MTLRDFLPRPDHTRPWWKQRRPTPGQVLYAALQYVKGLRENDPHRQKYALEDLQRHVSDLRDVWEQYADPKTRKQAAVVAAALKEDVGDPVPGVVFFDLED